VAWGGAVRWVKAFLVMRVGSKVLDYGIPDRKDPTFIISKNVRFDESAMMKSRE